MPERAIVRVPEVEERQSSVHVLGAVVIICAVLTFILITVGFVWIRLHTIGWSGQYSHVKATAGEVFDLGGNAQIVVPDGWSGVHSSSWRLPQWLGMHRSPGEARQMVWISPDRAARDRFLIVNYDTPSASWSQISTSSAFPHLDLSSELRVSGVRRAVPMRPADSAIRSIDVFLFIERSPCRLLVQLRLPASTGSTPTAGEVHQALRAAGLLLPAQ